jgi:EmrB/QacA subfamily drug resistance transporter
MMEMGGWEAIGNARPPGSVRWALAGLSLSMLLSSLGTSIANVALPTLAKTFDVTFQQVQWVVLSYLLTITALIVGAGRLGDMFGKRRVLLAGILLFVAASILCGLAVTLDILIVARAAQGVGAAILMALTLALVAETVPKERIGGAMGLLGTMSAIGTALGPSLGGLLIAGFGWRSIFLVGVPLGLAALALIHRYQPPDRTQASPDKTGFDLPGTLLLTATLAAYALSMTVGKGHFGQSNALLLFAAAVGFLLFVRVEAKAASPLVRLAMLSDASLRGGLAMSALVTTVLMATLVVGPFYLALALGLDPARVGLVMSAGPLVAAFTGVPAGRLADRIGTQRTTVAGLVGVVAGSMSMSALPPSLGVGGYLSSMVLMTAGYALFQAANNSAIMTGIEPGQRGLVSGLLNLSRNLGLVTGASLMGAVFAFTSGMSGAGSAPAAAVASGMRLTFAVGTLLGLAALAVALTGRSAGFSVRVRRA